MSRSTYLPIKIVIFCLLPTSQRSITMQHLLKGKVLKNPEGCTDVHNIDLSSEEQRQGYLILPHRVALRNDGPKLSLVGDNPLA